ncbi:MAG: hypothetical protein R3B06_00155 [Kofleriaceae bacterium]
MPPTALPDDDALTAPIRDLLALFAETLADVKFPDVDSRALTTEAKQVLDRAAEVGRAEAALAEARRTLVEAQDQLHQRAQRALAYARVYADGDAELSARLDAIGLPRPRAPRATTAAAPTSDAPRKRGRPRKEPAPTTLFSVPPAPPATPVAS